MRAQPAAQPTLLLSRRFNALKNTGFINTGASGTTLRRRGPRVKDRLYLGGCRCKASNYIARSSISTLRFCDRPLAIILSATG